MKKHNNKGLSVVELIIVVAIISIVVTVISVSLFRFIQRSRKQADVSNASTIAAAVQTALNETEIKNECASHMATGFIVWAPPGQPFHAFPGVAGPGDSSLFVGTLNPCDSKTLHQTHRAIRIGRPPIQMNGQYDVFICGVFRK